MGLRGGEKGELKKEIPFSLPGKRSPSSGKSLSSCPYEVFGAMARVTDRTRQTLEGPAVQGFSHAPSGSWLLWSRVSTCDHCPVWAQVWQPVPDNPMLGKLIWGRGLYGG